MKARCTGPSLQELVTDSKRVFKACRTIAPAPGREDLPSLYLYRHMITMADGVEVLCAAPNVVATIPLIRSMLEALIALKYIHEKDYERRSRCWLYCHLQEKIDLMEMLDPATERGKQFQAVAARESPDSEGWQFDSRPKTEPMKAELEKPYLVDIGREFKKCKKKGRPQWCSMFNGVHNLYEMAKEVNLERLYKMKHGPLSAVIHARDPDSSLFLQDDGSAGS